MPTSTDPKAISRRRFLKKTGWVAAGLTITAAAAYPLVGSIIPAMPSFGDPEPQDGFAWIQALPGGHIRFFCPRMEMGQGASIGLSQVVAEELNIDQSQIECLLPDTNQTPVFKMTVGSDSIKLFFDPVSLAAAQLRETLRGLAADKANLHPDQIEDGQGGFVLPDGTELSYGALVPSEPVVISAADLSAADAALPRYAVQRKGNFQAIGRSWKHHELEAIVTGQPIYSRDVSLDDMVYGQVLRPPAFGATIKSVDTRAAKAMPGITVVVADEGNNFVMVVNFVGVVSADPFALPAALAAIDVQWDIPEGQDQDQIDNILDVTRLRGEDDFEHTLAEAGDIGAGQTTARHQNAARYDTSFAAHAAMEPRAGVAWVKKDTVEIWCGTQDPFFVQQRVALLTTRPVDDVIVHSHRLGGGFGGRVQCQASEEAALLSAAVGRPVRVQWDREAEFQNNYFQPGYSHFINAGVADDGAISHWEHDYVSSPIATGPMPKNIGWVTDRMIADFGTSRGSLPPYQFAHQRTRFSDIRTSVPIGAWRGLGAAPNAFAIESMMDELAAMAEIDPLEFRLQNLPAAGDRLSGVLHRVAELSAWGKGAVATDTGRGMACAVYKDETPVAVVAEVLVDHAARDLRVTEIWCAQDCGLIINPDQVENLVMGNIVWGCSMALKERLTIKAGAVEQRNFDGYEILRHHESPEMTVALIQSDSAPVGVGESAFAPVAPAIANAVFAATGQRIRRLPVSYDDVFA